MQDREETKALEGMAELSEGQIRAHGAQTTQQPNQALVCNGTSA